jgi:hypothetical protein
MENLKINILNGTDMNLNLGDISENDHESFNKNIRFVEPHFLDLQTILRKENNG